MEPLTSRVNFLQAITTIIRLALFRLREMTANQIQLKGGR